MGFLKKAWHWLMIGCMVSMVAMAGHMAIIAHGANTGFLNVAGSYLGHIWTGLTQSAVPAVKALGVATKNLLASVGLMDPATISTLGSTPPPLVPPGIHEAMGHVMPPAPAPSPPALPSAPVPSLTDTFMGQFEKFAPDLQEQFRQQASRFGLSLQDVVSGYCAPTGP